MRRRIMIYSTSGSNLEGCMVSYSRTEIIVVIRTCRLRTAKGSPGRNSCSALTSLTRFRLLVLYHLDRRFQHTRPISESLHFKPGIGHGVGKNGLANLEQKVSRRILVEICRSLLLKYEEKLGHILRVSLAILPGEGRLRRVGLHFGGSQQSCEHVYVAQLAVRHIRGIIRQYQLLQRQIQYM